MMALANESICFSPPDRVAARWLDRSAKRGKRSVGLGDALVAFGSTDPVAEEIEVVGHSERPHNRLASDDLMQPHADPPRGTSFGDVQSGVHDASADGRF